MSLYTIAAMEAARKQRSPFIAQEGYITFYAMSDYTPGKLRSAMTPLGTYLFWQGLNIEDIRTYHPPLQAFGSKAKNLTVIESQESKISINGLMTQVGDDAAWFAAGHPPLLAFVDFVADSSLPSEQKGDIKNALNYVEQTVVIKDLHCTNSVITASDTNLVTWNLNFIGGEVVYLPVTTMDLP